MSWDDLKFVLAVVDAGSLLGAARVLGVDHTTVGRRVEAAEQALSVQLFTRSRSGYTLTSEGERMLDSLRRVEAAIHGVHRDASAQQAGLTGTLRLTTPETFGAHYLAPRLAPFMRAHPGLVVELLPAGTVLDLARREAEVAVRTFRTDREGLVLRRAAVVTYGFYGSIEYLRQWPSGPPDLARHPILSIPPASDEIEQRWLASVAPGVEPAFVSEVSTALQAAARQGAGLAILPCYVGDSDPELRRVPVPDPPSETLWMTVHRDLRKTPGVRALLDFLASMFAADASLFRGA